MVQERAVAFIEGDGVGPEIHRATRPVLEAALRAAYGPGHRIRWVEVLAGRRAQEAVGQLLPLETLQVIRECGVCLKGPLETPVGGGYRSLNVTLRQELDLYACIRPVRWFPGLPSPLRHPERVDMVVVREKKGSISLLQRELGLGYFKAAKLLNILEVRGVVAPYAGSIARKVIIGEEQAERIFAGEGP